jgi:hypothetical protein
MLRRVVRVLMGRRRAGERPGSTDAGVDEAVSPGGARAQLVPGSQPVRQFA